MIERDSETEELAAVLRDARVEHGRFAVIAGPAGIGKTTLLGALGERATVDGFRVLRARGTDIERTFGFGVVRQLLEPVVLSVAPEDRARLLNGAAGLCEPIFADAPHPAGIAATGVQAGSTHAEPLFRGLYWLAANLAERAPLALLVDDAQWADRPSLEWLAYLGRRIDDVAACVVLATREREPQSEARQVESFRDEVGALWMPLGPLSRDGVEKLATERLGHAPREGVIEWCYERTSGNPFLVQALLSSMANAGDRDGEMAAMASLPAPDAVRRYVRRALDRYGAPAAAVASAAATLEGDASPRLVASIINEPQSIAMRVADDLADAGLLRPGRTLQFVHPLVRTAVYDDLPASYRTELHARAWMLLARDGADVERIAAHILRSEPAGRPDVIEVLRRSAGRALARGAPEAAAEYLRRALAEGELDGLRPRLLLELGIAEARAGANSAPERLAAALDSLAAPEERLEAALELARTLTLRSRLREAVAALERAQESIEPKDLDAALRLEAEILGYARVAPSLRPLVAQRLARIGDAPPGGTPAERLLLANLAIEEVMAGHPAERAVELARRAWRGGWLLTEATAESSAVVYAANALMYSDRFAEAQAIFDAAVDDARARGSQLWYASHLTYRSNLAYRRGALLDAEADSHEALELTGAHESGLLRPAALAFFIDALLERAELEAARRVLNESGVPDDLPDTLMFNYLLLSRGRLQLALGNYEAALADLLLCGERHVASWGVPNPAGLCWASTAALAADALGRHEQALALSAQELDEARKFGAPRAIGIAMTVAGILERASRGRVLLERAVDVLRGAGAPLEHARAEVELGSVLRRAGRRTAARDALRRGLDTAHRCGSIALVNRAREELVALGFRPRRPAFTGPDALTPAERRVAMRAAAGRTNREIAQDLFVTRRTVETHLKRAYEKLGVTTRGELAEALR